MEWEAQPCLRAAHAQGVPKGLGRRGWRLTCLSPSFQVVDLLNQAALITNDSKITVLKQVRGWAKWDGGGRMGTCDKRRHVLTVEPTFQHLGYSCCHLSAGRAFSLLIPTEAL